MSRVVAGDCIGGSPPFPIGRDGGGIAMAGMLELEGGSVPAVRSRERSELLMGGSETERSSSSKAAAILTGRLEVDGRRRFGKDGEDNVT